MIAEEEQLFVSVVMPVYNALPHLDEAMRSMLDQTYRNFEFVILDDASTDGSAERLREWATKDSRIRLFESDANLGPVGSSNFVVEKAKSSIIARMDADDVCRDDRLQLQTDVLHGHSEVGLVASAFEIIDEFGQRLREPELWRVARKSAFAPFGHGSIMFRRDLFHQVGGYRAECEYWEDQDLAARFAAVSEVRIIPLALYQVRQWSRKTQATTFSERHENAVDLMYRCVARLEANQSYDDLLLQSRSQSPACIDPRVFISLGSRQLWAGKRPILLRRLLRRGKLGPDMRTFSALIWTIWASVSPWTLRLFLRLLLDVKNARASRIAADPRPIRWSPTGK